MPCRSCRCTNCGHRIDKHCQAHVIPCCPGKCPLDLAAAAVEPLEVS